MSAKDYYESSVTPAIVDIRPVTAIAVDGVGAPGGPVHMQAIKTLCKAAGDLAQQAAAAGRSFEIPPMEGLWSVGGDRPALEVPREEWHWELIIQVPREVVVPNTARAENVKLVKLHEGLCVQALHVGPYSTESDTLARMDALMRREGLERNGRHHEIYLTPVTDNPSEGRTILRQPVRRVTIAPS